MLLVLVIWLLEFLTDYPYSPLYMWVLYCSSN